LVVLAGGKARLGLRSNKTLPLVASTSNALRASTLGIADAGTLFRMAPSAGDNAENPMMPAAIRMIARGTIERWRQLSVPLVIEWIMSKQARPGQRHLPRQGGYFSPERFGHAPTSISMDQQNFEND
jgi:hypothetical protein